MQPPSDGARGAGGADKAAAALPLQGQQARPSPAAAAGGGTRRRALTLPEMRSKAAFRACLR